MEYTAFEQKMSKDEAYRLASNKGDWLWHLVFYKYTLAELKMMYIEYVLLELETESTVSILERLRQKVMPVGDGSESQVKKKIQVLVNGTTGGVALVSDHPQITSREITEQDCIQHCSFQREDNIRRAKKLVHKITHRTMGGLHSAELVSYTTVYRPFWVAFYAHGTVGSEIKEGDKVRYITIPADGGHNRRVR